MASSSGVDVFQRRHEKEKEQERRQYIVNSIQESTANTSNSNGGTPHTSTPTLTAVHPRLLTPKRRRTSMGTTMDFSNSDTASTSDSNDDNSHASTPVPMVLRPRPTAPKSRRTSIEANGDSPKSGALSDSDDYLPSPNLPASNEDRQATRTSYRCSRYLQPSLSVLQHTMFSQAILEEPVARTVNPRKRKAQSPAPRYGLRRQRKSSYTDMYEHIDHGEGEEADVSVGNYGEDPVDPLSIHDPGDTENMQVGKHLSSTTGVLIDPSASQSGSSKGKRPVEEEDSCQIDNSPSAVGQADYDLPDDNYENDGDAVDDDGDYRLEHMLRREGKEMNAKHLRLRTYFGAVSAYQAT